ncbi:pyroglutamyl-peptidase I [Bacillus sp. FJAT-44742]|uniref:pyroglutamyl-peptidase I n=1 Tax=Bacillus sp. FJAT-44742 TaxID=2014005 RepID=UPI001E31641D|nr:pyroglutamyl-peptidase I [Bacillus sp. FJAT-44742]
MKIKVLCSGFEPFGGLEVNPTVQLVKELEEEQPWAHIELKSIELPVVYETCAQSLLEAIEKEKPDIIISCGLAYGRSAISLERIGINIQDTKGEGEKGDNTGEKPVDKPIHMNGPDGLFSTLPLRKMLEALQQNGIPAEISNTAGTYICNTTLYQVLYFLREKEITAKAGFIHFPAIPEMTLDRPHLPSMTFTYQKKALMVAVQAAAEGYYR